MMYSEPALPKRGPVIDERPLARETVPEREVSGVIAHAARHSLMVARSKYIIAALALLVIAMLVIWPLTDTGQKGIRMVPAEHSIEATQKNPKMVKPRFQGVNKEGQPYSLVADEALQQEGRYVLRNITADMTQEDGTWLSLVAKNAEYLEEKELVKLRGKVALFSDAGYELQTDELTVDLTVSSLDGPVSVYAQGPLGTLEAARFVVENGGEKIWFYENVRVVAWSVSDK